MTQAYNLAILANAVNSSGQLNVGTNATGVLPQANGGTGSSSLGSVAVTSVSAGSGISVSASTGAVTISASGGGVTSLNGQTGAITDTGYNNIGSYMVALVRTTAGAGYSRGSTVAGSSIRYSTTYAGQNGAFGSGSGGAEPLSNGANTSNPGLSGTYRAMGMSGANNAGKDGVWSIINTMNLWVRVS